MTQNNHPFACSEQLLARALKTIPLGTQTFSKSHKVYPHGISPFYAARAKGSHLWDADENQYIDFVSSLCAITLGYQDPDVNTAVRAQMEKGSLFSLPHRIEIEVAESICKMVPCAEMVRFGKNGSDATSGAVRLARAFTGRDRVAVCGYHGWQDWYIGSTSRNLGVPKVVQELTHSFKFNNLESLHKLLKTQKGEFACIVMEAMNTEEPAPNFLEGVQALAREHGAVFILDETITGFRFSKGGAQELFNITPDLATFGKGLSNGYPLSAIAGRADIMGLMEDIFFSFTMGSETLSLAAAKATLEKINREPVIEQLKENGNRVISGVKECITRHGAQHIFSVSGHPSWSFLNIKDIKPYTNWEIRTYLFQEMFKRQILMLGAHNMSYAHTNKDISHLLWAYDEILPLVKQVIAERSLLEKLNCEPLVPLFRVR
jgi:glutamate-1-semialdehyde 2,1-aminomutase